MSISLVFVLEYLGLGLILSGLLLYLTCFRIFSRVSLLSAYFLFLVTRASFSYFVAVAFFISTRAILILLMTISSSLVSLPLAAIS